MLCDRGQGHGASSGRSLGSALRRRRAVLRDETSNHSGLWTLLAVAACLRVSVGVLREECVWRAFECVAFRACSNTV